MISLKLLKNTSFLKVFNNSSWLLAERIIGIISSLILSIYLTKFLGVEGFGRLNFILSVVALIIPIASMGLNGILIRELVNKPGCSGVILYTSFLLRFISSVVVLSVLVASTYIGDWFPHYDRPNLLILAIGNVFLCFQVVDYWFQSKLLSLYMVKIRVVTLVVFSFLKVISLIYSGTLELIIIITASEIFIQSLFLLLPYKRIANNFNEWKFDFSYAKQLLSQSYWLILSGFAAVLYLKIDQVMIGILLGSEGVGVYALAARLSEIWYFIPTAIVTSIFPLLLASKKESMVKYNLHLERAFSILFWLALVIAVFMQFLATPLIHFIYGEHFSQSANVLTIHIWSGVFIFMRTLFSKWIIAEGYLYFSLLSQGAGALINVFLNYLLIPIYGVEGAAVTTFISYGVASFFILFLDNNTRNIAFMMFKSIFYPLSIVKNKLMRD